MTETDLCFMPATEMVDSIRARTLSSVEITSTVLKRIERLEPKLNAFAWLAADEAMDAAQAADRALARGEPMGPLHGVPVTIKDHEAVRGMQPAPSRAPVKLWGPDDPLFPATRVDVGPDLRFHRIGLERRHWASAGPVRVIFRRVFTSADLPYFPPHRLRNTLAGRDEINVLPTPRLVALNVVNNGLGPTKWTIEGATGLLYAKGERLTSNGINKFMVVCESSRLSICVIFDPVGRGNEIPSLNA